MKHVINIIAEVVIYAIWALIALLCLTCLSYAQTGGPDQRGEAITGPPPAYQGQTALPMLPADAVKNEGGSDGQGLCVPASVLTNGIYQGVPGLSRDGEDGHRGHGSEFWRTVKSRPGGYYPEKLQKLVNEVMPNEKWASYWGPNTAVLDQLSRAGYPVAATMNTGRQYNYQKISHMVSLPFYRKGGLTCVLDNNFPNVYSWMPSAEFDRRWLADGANGWAWWWLRRKAAAAAGSVLVLVAAGCAALVIVLTAMRRGQAA